MILSLEIKTLTLTKGVSVLHQNSSFVHSRKKKVIGRHSNKLVCSDPNFVRLPSSQLRSYGSDMQHLVPQKPFEQDFLIQIKHVRGHSRWNSVRGHFNNQPMLMFFMRGRPPSVCCWLPVRLPKTWTHSVCSVTITSNMQSVLLLSHNPSGQHRHICVCLPVLLS